jgi:hypothetical protein
MARPLVKRSKTMSRCIFKPPRLSLCGGVKRHRRRNQLDCVDKRVWHEENGVPTRQGGVRLGNLRILMKDMINENIRYTKVKVVRGCLAFKDLPPPDLMDLLLLPGHASGLVAPPLPQDAG